MCECWWMLTGVSPCCLADSPNKLWLLNTHKWMSSRSRELKHITTGSVHTSDLLWSASVCWSNILSWDSLLKSEQEPQIQLMILCDELLPPEAHNTLSFHRLLIWKISTIAALTIKPKRGNKLWSQSRTRSSHRTCFSLQLNYVQIRNKFKILE